jgi:DNA-binding MarR family transcriptional regulator
LCIHTSIPISELNGLLNISERTIRDNLSKLTDKELITISFDSEDLRKRIVKLNIEKIKF